ncbi:MAG TPA: hypothetical protein VHO46_12930 [Bacteroidales bacterium]|nr:hypothetical protein [Bacteroidales bacterium]
MKRIYTLLVLFLSGFAGAWAQNPIVVSEDQIDIGNSTVPGYSVVIPEVSYETIRKNWIKQLESGTRSKVVEDDDKLSIFGAKIEPVSQNPVNVYSFLKDQDGYVNLRVAMELDHDKYAGSEEYANARRYLFDFAKEEYMAIVNEQLNEEQKKLRSLKNDLSSAENDKSRMERSSKSDAEIIEEERGRLAELRKDLTSLSEEQYQGDSATVTGMGAVSPDEVKDLEKERKKLNREIKSSEEKIQKADEELKENERSMPGTDNKIESLKGQVEDQEKVVAFFEKKLDTIKSYK